ncbi:heat shock protein GrpE [Methylobacterium sp. ME121]|jgi:molecular chaperone GrpE|nr:nucleotide exchange factor GrpE [Methylobacterium organophilum]GAN47543.1 heat shock protein GrpE [Methylobacterium sp. ME121]GEM97316.1 protein GrpE [Methylobacterium radiotolerans]
MTSNDMPQDDQRQTTVEAGAGAAQDPAPAGQGSESATVDPVAEALALLTAERDELKDRTLRTLAEMENLRRRTEREVADARAYAVTNFARDVLNVADNIRRALDSVPADAKATADGALKGLIDGIELTERDLAKTLERHGVKIVEPQGQKFDPNRHQAMFEVPNAEVPAGTVVQVVQAGYVIGERVLRPALVGVAKGGPKAAANPADAA